MTQIKTTRIDYNYVIFGFMNTSNDFTTQSFAWNDEM